MKKILTVSLGALLVATAANADIASVDYVTGQLAGKQNTISDLDTIRSGAALGATAAQDLGDLGVTATATELNYVDGVTSNIQTQLNSKQAALGYTPEDRANKLTAEDGLTSSATDDQYPSAKSVYKGLEGKVNIKQGTDNAGKGLIVDRTSGMLVLAEIATQAELNDVSATAAAAQTTANSKQPKSTAAYQMGNASGGWTAMTSVQQNALNSGVTSTTVTQVATNTTNIARKQDALGYTPEDRANKLTAADGLTSSATDDQYTSAKLMFKELKTKVDVSYGTANAGKGLVVDRTSGDLALTDIATQEELNSVASTAAAGQTATQVNTAITNAIGGLDFDMTGESGKFVIYVKQENGQLDAGVKDFVNTLSAGVKDAPTTGAVYDALQGKVSVAGNTASKAVITDPSGNITTGTIETGMITDGAVTSIKIANSTIVDADISGSANIAQSKIAGLTTSLNGKQVVVSSGVEGNFYVADYKSKWGDMFSVMPKDERCTQDNVKCALTHKAGKYAWEVVKE